MTEAQTLEAAFLEDHRHLTRGLERLRLAVSDDDPARAAAMARELDETAGPHMAFEEDVFYPALRGVLGDAYVDRLYGEHACGQDAVRRLLACGDLTHFADEERAALARDLTTALEHALSCGTLLSHVERLPAEDRTMLLDALVRLRRSGRRWTTLDTPRPVPERG